LWRDANRGISTAHVAVDDPAANHFGCGSLRHEMGIVANGLDAQ
jgi:hypothetical protein